MKTGTGILVLLVLSLAWNVRAQRIEPAVLAAAGGLAEASGISISWTAGQTAAELRAAHFGTLSEGFQQAFLTVVPVRERSVPFTIDLFPNPTRTSVIVMLDGVDEDLTLVLYNLLGEPVFRQQARSGDTRIRISFEMLPNGMYLLAAFTAAGDRQALYKIVKAE